jgi:glutathione peroxidase
MKILILITSALLSLMVSSIYTLQLTTLSGTNISLAQYQAKKILVVNIASSSEYAAEQLPQLQQLYQLYKDSVEVIAFPSNDFGNEPLADSTLQLLMQNTYGITFPVSISTGIIDSLSIQHPLYQWLQSKQLNGIIDTKIKTDFQKYLIGKDGNIIGIFSPATSPLDSLLVQAILQ